MKGVLLFVVLPVALNVMAAELFLWGPRWMAAIVKWRASKVRDPRRRDIAMREWPAEVLSQGGLAFTIWFAASLIWTRRSAFGTSSQVAASSTTKHDVIHVVVIRPPTRTERAFAVAILGLVAATLGAYGVYRGLESLSPENRMTVSALVISIFLVVNAVTAALWFRRREKLNRR